MQREAGPCSESAPSRVERVDDPCPPLLEVVGVLGVGLPHPDQDQIELRADVDELALVARGPEGASAVVPRSIPDCATSRGGSLAFHGPRGDHATGSGRTRVPIAHEGA